MARLGDFELTEGEKALCAALREGEMLILGNRPGPDAGADRQVSADFLRYVLEGGCKALWGERDGLAADGLRVYGARITGWLDLEGMKLDHDLLLADCHFDAAPLLRAMRLDSLNLHGSHLPGLYADRLEARGNVFLRQVESTGENRLPGAKLGGNLSCIGARLTAGQSGKALNAEGARVAGTLFWRKVKAVKGRVSLIAARFGQIADEKASWPDELALDRCLYDAFVGGAPVSGAARIDWLDRQDRSGEGAPFEPQPWEQCAKVLREMGHEAAALEVLVEKEKRQRAAHRQYLRGAALFEDAWMARLRDGVLRWVVGYGYRPFRALGWPAGFWLLGAVVFYNAYQHDAMKPADTRTLYQQEWADCARSPACFLATAKGGSYPRFDALVYSADTLLPAVNLEVQPYWIPAQEAGGWGVVAQWFLWLQIIAGWALSLLAVAGFSGLIRRG